MHTLKYNVVGLNTRRAALIELTIEYLTWVSDGTEAALGRSLESLVGMSIPDYAKKTIDEICDAASPRGVFYLVETHGEPAAMIGLRYLREGVAEIKRLYVRPAYRGRHFGETCLRKVLRDARAFGYQSALLATGPFMYSAQRLYRRCGFKQREPYREVELPAELHPSWVFMECDLSGLALGS